MTSPCPGCGSSRTTAIESRPIPGGRRRRHQCHVCRHRWTTYIDTNGLAMPAPPRPKPALGVSRPSKRRCLTDDQVWLILTNPQRSLNDLAGECQTNRETVRHVRIGLAYLDVHPQLPRQTTKPRETPEVSCLRCRSWVGGECSFGFPDPIEEGPDFAADCDLFELRNDL